MNGSLPNIPPPATLTATVVKLKRHGALVKLSSGSEAWLPAAEYKPGIGFKTDLRTTSGLAVGNKVEVVVYQEPFHDQESSRVFVSHRRASKDDPWHKVRNWDGQTVKVMEVRLVTEMHAVGSIEPGIHGEVLLEDLKPLFPPHWQNFAYIVPGDTLAGFVRAKDQARWMVTLDVAGYIQSEVRVEDVLGPVLTSASPQVNLHSLQDTTPRNHRSSLPVKRLFVVDNDLHFGKDIKSYLAAYGCDVAIWTDSQQALAALESLPHPFDLALIDIHLAGTTDFTGLGLAVTIQERFPDLPIVLITADDEAVTNPNLTLRDDLRICDIILKPMGTDDLWRAVAAQTKKPQKLRDLFGSTPQTRSLDVPSLPSEDEAIENVLSELAAEVKAESAVLFSIHPDSMRVNIEASHDPHGLVPSVKANIERSPINDVAIEGEEVYAGYAPGRAEFAKHRWLQRAYSYRSCLAVPVKVKSELTYGLFCFHRERDAFRSEQMSRVRQAALVLGSLLHAERLESLLAEREPYELLGKAYGSMAHDLKEALSVGLNLDTLVELLERPGGHSPEDLATLRQDVKTLVDRWRLAGGIAKTFRDVARGDKESKKEIILCEVLASHVESLQHQYPRVRQLVVSNDFNRGDRVQLRPTALYQLLCNLVLNANQQIDRLPFRLKYTGQVFVELAQESREDGLWACIRVHDNGPGIHPHQFEKVFEVGFSTKEGGFGMGLDICRRIATGVRAGERCGSVRVLRSILFVGTSFEVLLPIS